MSGKCPSCAEPITHLLAEIVRVDCDQPTHDAMTYRCPNCSVVLACQADTTSIQRDIAKIVDDAFCRRAMF